MTTEDMNILLNALCCGIPYGTMVRIMSTGRGPIRLAGVYYDGEGLADVMTEDGVYHPISDVKPYLIPTGEMSTEEQFELFGYRLRNDMYLQINFLSRKHYDTSDLIEKGLAIKVTNEFNPYAQ